MKWSLRIGLILLLLAVAVGAALTASRIVSEKRPVWQDDSLRQQVTQGRLFALQKFLAKQTSLPQQTWRYWQRAQTSAEDAKSPVLLFVENSNDATATDYASLFAWIETGNHVVLPLPENLALTVDDQDAMAGEALENGEVEDENQPLTAAQYRQLIGYYLDIIITNNLQPEGAGSNTPVPPQCVDAEKRRQQADRAVNPNWREDKTQTKNRLRACQQQLNRIALPQGQIRYWLSSSGNALQMIDEQRAQWQGHSMVGSHIVRVAYGEGSVVLIDSLNALSNPSDPMEDVDSLNQYDHAYLAAYLAEGKKMLWFVRHLGGQSMFSSQPAWWRMWQAEPLLMLLLSLLLLSIIWRLGTRIGAIRQLPVPQERYLRAHIGARGRFLAHSGWRAAQLQWLQQQWWQQCQQQWPQWPQMSLQARLQVVCQQKKHLPLTVVKLWLQPLPARPTTAQWRNYLRAHQRLQQAAAAGVGDSRPTLNHQVM